MPVDLLLRCRCGAVQGVAMGVEPAVVNRVVCYCDDCQAYVHRLGADGVLDAHGGTDIAQMSIARVRIDQGVEHVAALQLRPGGMQRWHTTCCQTPIGNTMASPRWPFIGLIHSFCDHREAPRDVVFGEPTRIQGRFATGDTAGMNIHPGAPLGGTMRLMRRMLGWWWRGDAGRSAFTNLAQRPNPPKV